MKKIELILVIVYVVALTILSVIRLSERDSVHHKVNPDYNGALYHLKDGTDVYEFDKTHIGRIEKLYDQK